MMSDFLESLVQGSQKRIILCRWKYVVTNSIRVIAQLEIGVCISPWESLAGTR
jgi:hypothetical protein